MKNKEEPDVVQIEIKTKMEWVLRNVAKDMKHVEGVSMFYIYIVWYDEFITFNNNLFNAIVGNNN